MNRLIRVSLLLALVLGITAAAAWWWLPQKNSAENRYVTAPLERGSITQSVSANGTLNPVKLVNVGSQVSGIVTKLYVDFNDHVKAGQVLLELDPALIRAQLQQSEASVASAEATLELARANEARTRSLFAQEYVTRQDLDQAVQALKAAQAQMIVAQAQAARDRANLSYTVIRSPVAGVVVSRQVDLGQTVAASFQTPTLFQIAQDLSKMQIDSNYAEADIGSIRVGQPATFRVDAYPNRSFRGAVRQVRLNPTTQQNVVTYDVVVAVDNPDQILMPGMTAYVSITVAQRPDALLVPNAALRFRPGDGAARPAKRDSDKSREERGATQVEAPTATVYVLENGQPKALRIAIGITDSRSTEVLDQKLKAGTQVIVEDRQPPAKNTVGPGMRLF
ncbi:MAG: efflux RND transporter periplasmic adaptor subunit [Pseudomonadota bacterium]